MVKTNNKNKWLRRYRTFFILGAVILFFQIVLAARFLALNRILNAEESQWEPSSPELSESEPQDAAIFARKGDNDDPNHSSTVKIVKSGNNQTHLKAEDLGFQLPCTINTKEALSALSRAKTQECKRMIANITCIALENKLYPKELKSLCPAGAFKIGKELGCFKDEKNFRLLNGYFGVSKTENSPKYCIKMCLQSGYMYAGVQYSDECFCGSDEPPLTSKVPDSSCNMKCPGDQHETCGGYFAMNVFQTGIKKFIPRTANESSVVEKPVKIVFLLTLNGRALRQVRRLIRILYHKDHFYYIHVDVRQDYLFRELLPLEKIYPNVRLTRRRFATIWGGASLLTMLRSCMSELLASDWSWDFVLNLSESDFPVKPVSELTRFLSANRDRNFVKSHGREVQRFIQKQGLDKTFVECENRMWRVGGRQLPFGVQIDGGSDWIALSRPFVRYAANPTPDVLVSGLLEVFKRTLLPAESFFHTTLRNSRFCDTYVDNNLHVTNWKRKLGCKCQYKHVVDWCGCSPNDFTSDDWQKIINTQSRHLYFARKFEPVVNQAVILRLELWLYGLEEPSKNVVNLHSYWQSVYHHEDLGVSPDDTLKTFAGSVQRHLTRMLSNSTASCGATIGKLLEVTSFHEKDRYKYTLFKFDSFNGLVEVALRPLKKFTVVKSGPLTDHLVSLFVSSDYDQKEQISRNFLRGISSYSDPVLVYRFEDFHTSKQYNLTSLWIDPLGRLQDVVDFTVDEASPNGHVKPVMKQPHLPGVWRIEILYKESQLAHVSFLVIPLEFVHEKPISDAQLVFLHAGLENGRIPNDNYAKFLPNASQRQLLKDVGVANSKRRGQELVEWVDSLIFTFYRLDKVCGQFEAPKTDMCGNRMAACVRTNWSSLAPDPKSAISDVNQKTGTYDVW